MTAGPRATAVLCSGGLDSVVLAAALSREAPVHPVYVSVGLAWEADERAALARVVSTPGLEGRFAPLVVLDVTMRDVYGDAHWAMTGQPPAYDTPDEDVYLAGRNVILLTKAGIFCQSVGLHRIAIGPLAGNPFPDATPVFFEAMARALSLGLAHDLDIVAPFASRTKAEVIRLGRDLGVPLHLSLSCMAPRGGRHCGLCSKCRERRDAFAEAGVVDTTDYAAAAPRSGAAPLDTTGHHG